MHVCNKFEACLQQLRLAQDIIKLAQDQIDQIDPGFEIIQMIRS
jgi:hypothetical protein